MEIKGTVKLKKVTPAAAVYALSLPGLQTANLVVDLTPGKMPGAAGTVTVVISAPAKKKK